MSRHVQEAQWSQLSELIAGSMGLHFPRERQEDLERGFTSAAQELGFEDVAVCMDWLLTGPPNKAQLQVLASHLTIGETYFFRDPQILQALTEKILPELIRNRRGRDQRLHIWSAACCSGEEAYTLAILVHQLLPDLHDWRVTVTATDINTRFLQKASVGRYGEWSFRDTPAWLKQRYFKLSENGLYTVIPEIKNLVTFTHLNLVEDTYPSSVTDTNGVDVIFCRNVLMYFTPRQVKKVISNLSGTLVKDGWLIVSPSEASQALFPQFTSVNFPGAILFQKGEKSHIAEVSPEQITEFPTSTNNPLLPRGATTDPKKNPGSSVLNDQPRMAMLFHDALATAQLLYKQARYAEVADNLLAALSEHPSNSSSNPAALSLLTRALANLGRLTTALTWCDRWIEVDKLDHAAHYLRAVILLEHGYPERARPSLQRAVYLHPGFVLAHFALGNIARGRKRMHEAGRYFSNALRLLRDYEPNDLLPETDCLTASRLTEIIKAAIAKKNIS